MQSGDLLATLDYLPHPRVLVMGDLMLDRYTWGAAERISPEAPVLVLQAGQTEDRLGGAANCAHMARGLEAGVSLVGVVGSDQSGEALRKLASAAGIDSSGIVSDGSRPTTLKERFLGGSGGRNATQILRVDRESRAPVSQQVQEQLLAHVLRQLPSHDVLLISDYAKGLCAPELLRHVMDAAREANVPVLVDPARGCDYARYRGATLLKPNRVETELATGRKIGSPQEALSAARKLCDDFQVTMSVVTLDRDGMALASSQDDSQLFASQARAICDITGAGDMVMAMLGVCLAGGIAPAEAVQLANIAGGLEVEKTGVAIVTRDEIRRQLLAMRPQRQSKVLSLDAAVRLVRERKASGQKVVFTNGCFDLLHVGHVSYLAEAAALGDMLIVGVNSDQSVRKLKGQERPVISELDRAAMLAALACVDAVIVFDDDTPHRLLHALHPDVLVKGGTYTPQEVVGREVVESYGGQVAVTGMIDGVSTTRIIQSVSGSESPHSTAFRRAG